MRIERKFTTAGRDAYAGLEFARTQGKIDAYIERVYRAYFVEGVNISGLDTIVRLGAEAGLDAEKLRASVASRQFENILTQNDTDAEAMGLEEDTPLLYIKRRRLAGETPAAVMSNYLPPKYAHLDESALTHRGLYELLREMGVRPVIAHQVIGARRPTAAERKLLRLAPGDPLLTMTRRAYDAAGSPVEYGDHCYRFDQYAFDVTVHEL